jgi:hypothetical protein
MGLRRTGIAALAAVAMLITANLGSAPAEAATMTIAPSAPESGTNTYPFGWTGWTPNLLFVYKNIPAFSLRTGDTISFDLQGTNNVPIQLAIALAPTAANGGDAPATAFTQVVPSTQVPANPTGNTVGGDYELTFTSQAPFSFPGGGMVMRFSNPAGAFASDSTPSGVFVNSLGASSDPSGYFVERINQEPDGEYPWPTGPSSINFSNIAGFRMTVADPPVVPPAQPATAKKKCKKKKKKHHRAASTSKKKCKKKKKR